MMSAYFAALCINGPICSSSRAFASRMSSRVSFPPRTSVSPEAITRLTSELFAP